MIKYYIRNELGDNVFPLYKLDNGDLYYFSLFSSEWTPSVHSLTDKYIPLLDRKQLPHTNDPLLSGIPDEVNKFLFYRDVLE